MPSVAPNRAISRIAWTPLLALVIAAGCREPAVVVYTALDEEFSRSVFREFTATTGIEVRPKFDTESNKTVGLTQAIFAERSRPRCDLFWNNEILNTLRLEKAGLLRPYTARAAENFPAFARSPNATWYGFAARARVLIVNTDLVQVDQRPRSILELTDTRWKKRCAIAKPLFGTTATHAAVLHATWGPARAETFFRDVHRNAQTLAGNRHVAQAVAAGQAAWGLTDTDDAIIEVEKGQPVAIVYPDAGETDLGTLFIPNTLALLKGSSAPDRGERLLEYLLSPAVEAQLATGPSAQIPLQRGLTVPLRTETPETVRAMEVDWGAACDHWEDARTALTEIFAAAE